MEKLIDSFVGLVEVLLCGSLVFWGGSSALRYAHDQVKGAAIEALKKPTPSLSNFTQKLTR